MPYFSTRTAALRSLMDISADAVKHAKDLITERADGKFYFDEDAAEQFLNTQDDITNAHLENTMTTEITLENFKSASTADLVAFYNDHAESSVKKFRDRATAEKKVQMILEAVVAEEPVAKPEPMIGNMSLSDTVAFAKSVAGKKAKIAKAEKPVKAPKSDLGEMIKSLVKPEVTDDVAKPAKTLLPNAEEILKQHGCPYCGDTANGCTYDDAPGKETEYMFCHICNTSFSSEDGHLRSARKASSGNRQVSDTQAETMKTTLKLDRTIVATDGDEEALVLGEWKNAFQMWKEHADWMTSAQQDGLTAKLYKAAKEGKQIAITINGRDFYLKNV